MRNVVKVLLLAVLLAATCFGSYKAVIAIWGEDEITSMTESKQGTGTTEVRDKKVKNLLVTAYYYDNYTKDVISYAAVRFFNVNTKECNYIFFPGNTKVKMSNDTYSTLFNASSNIKQECLLSDIAPCFVRDDDRYGYTTMVLEDALGVKIDCYESITSDNVIRIVNLLDPVSFNVKSKLKFKDDSNIDVVLKPGEQTLLGDQVKGMLTKPELYSSEKERLEVSMEYINNYLSTLVTMKDRAAQGEYYQQYYDLIMSNTNFSAMRPYMVYLYQITPANIHMSVADGSYSGSFYNLDYNKLRELAKSFNVATAKIATTEEATTEAATKEAATTESATTEADKTEAETTEEATTEEATTEEATTEEEKEKDSKNLTIEIYNSTTINGLAARWKSKLEGDGYSISATETERTYHLKECEIIVKKKGMGKDLKKYFPNAKIKVDKSVLTKADIRIVLGTNNNNVK